VHILSNFLGFQHKNSVQTLTNAICVVLSQFLCIILWRKA